MLKAVSLIKQSRNLLVLSGSKLSDESGVPELRSSNVGHWESEYGNLEQYKALAPGNKVPDPTDLASRAAFDKMPDTVWGWY